VGQIEAVQEQQVSRIDRPRGSTSPGLILLVWILLVVLLQAIRWLGGFRPVALGVAVEEGAERVETRAIGEVGDDVIRKAIQTQRATHAFWTAVALLADFVIEPLSLVVRAALVAMAFASLAALRGRPIDVNRGFTDAALAQGFWVLGLAVRVGLMMALRRTEVETSLVLALPPGPYAGSTWAALRQVDAFATMGWIALGAGAVRRRQAGVLEAVLVCLVLWTCEASVRIVSTLVVEAGMRLAIMPES
jgi:hypothetical protein